MLTNTVQQIVNWLRARPVLNIILVFGYFIILLFMHKPLAQLSLDYESRISIQVYNHMVEAVYVVFIICVIALVIRFLKKNPDNTGLKLTYLTLTIGAVVIHSRFMFDSKIEVIHSFEFTFLAFLIFPLFNRFGAAVFFTLPFMLFDEWYQYIFLYPYLDYLDLNDIVMDTYGTGVAISLLMIIGVKGAQHVEPLWKRPELRVLVAGSAAVLIAVKLCYIAPYGNEICGNTTLIINQSLSSEPFMRLHPTHHSWFHVMKPLEAFIAITTLHLFYFGTDSFRK